MYMIIIIFFRFMHGISVLDLHIHILVLVCVVGFIHHILLKGVGHCIA